VSHRARAVAVYLLVIALGVGGCGASFRYVPGRLASVSSEDVCVQLTSNHARRCWNGTILTAVPAPLVGSCVWIKIRGEDPNVAVLPSSAAVCG
jgi:hypothetical protein